MLVEYAEGFLPYEACLKFMPNGKFCKITDYDFDDTSELTLPPSDRTKRCRWTSATDLSDRLSPQTSATPARKARRKKRQIIWPFPSLPLPLHYPDAHGSHTTAAGTTKKLHRYTIII